MNELDEMLTALNRLADVKTVAARIASAAAPQLKDSLVSNLAKGVSPEGAVWAPRKEDGGRAYANAASKIDVKSYGDLIKVTLKGPEVYGHFGANGMPERQMLPDAGRALPQSVRDALVKGAEEVLDDIVKGPNE